MAGETRLSPAQDSEPAPDCALCPRLAAFRQANRAARPEWHNRPVPRFADPEARLLVIGLAPGLRGANRTGRPFTGDGAGLPLYRVLDEFGFTTGVFAGEAGDGLGLADCAITNAVRCVPPQNRPTGAEIRTCRRFLAADLAGFPRLRIALTLGRIAHESTVRALGATPRSAPFRHGGCQQLAGITVHASYHCSRYNMNTGRLTLDDLRRVMARIRAELGPRETPAAGPAGTSPAGDGASGAPAACG